MASKRFLCNIIICMNKNGAINMTVRAIIINSKLTGVDRAFTCMVAILTMTSGRPTCLYNNVRHSVTLEPGLVEQAARTLAPQGSQTLSMGS